MAVPLELVEIAQRGSAWADARTATSTGYPSAVSGSFASALDLSTAKVDGVRPYGCVKAMASLRLSVMFMPAMMASNFPALSAGITPSKACATISHLAFIRLHRSSARSISKPISLPLESVKFHGL